MRPHTRAGYMTAPDYNSLRAKCPCRKGAVHTFADADRLLAAPKAKSCEPARPPAARRAEPCEPAALKFHPMTEIIPMDWMPDDELHALADSIRAVGQLHPIVVDQKTDMIVDGRLRWRACEMAGVEPKIERREFADERDILDFVISMNVHRSHNTEDQRAIAAGRLANVLSAPHEPEPSEPARPEAEPRPATDWVSRSSAELDAIIAKADERLRELQAGITADKIDGWENRMRVLLALRNESLKWANSLTEARVRYDREFALAAPDELDALGACHAGDLRLYALADDETFAAAIETVMERDEELTDKRLQREIEWRLKQRSPGRPGLRVLPVARATWGAQRGASLAIGPKKGCRQPKTHSSRSKTWPNPPLLCTRQ